eukprot:scaffold1551_cov164-Ochromonas_danica.AAC.3
MMKAHLWRRQRREREIARDSPRTFPKTGFLGSSGFLAFWSGLLVFWIVDLFTWHLDLILIHIQTHHTIHEWVPTTHLRSRHPLVYGVVSLNMYKDKVEVPGEEIDYPKQIAAGSFNRNKWGS